MGVDPEDEYYPLQSGSHVDQNGDNIFDGIATTIQAHYDTYANQKNQSVQVILDGADPRFTKPTGDKEKAIAGSNLLTKFEIIDLSYLVPTLGAWYSEDCKLQYKNVLGRNWTGLCNMSEEDLYENPKYYKEHLLPTLPPKQSILYYRPLEIRNEISAYYQDHDDLAKFLAMMSANPGGGTSKREWEKNTPEDQKPTYPDCELYKDANSTINSDGSGRNSLTTGGIAMALMAPGSLKNLEYEADPDTPVCLIAGEDEPVLLKQIQKPGEVVCTDEMRLCGNGDYWNNYFLTNLGVNNNSLQFTMAGENKEDSYSRRNMENGELLKTGADVNELPFQKGQEGKGSPFLGGQGATTWQDGQQGKNSGGTVMAITGIPSGTEAAAKIENTTNFLGQPFENEEDKKEISSGIPYYISTRPVAWGQYSKTNSHPESIITSASHDSGILLNADGDRVPGTGYLDPYAFNSEMECESCGKEHYPEDIFNTSDNNKIIGGSKWGGSRTPFEGITVTSVAEKRTDTLSVGPRWADRLDSAISISTGHSFIDWGMVKMKGRVNTGEGILDFLKSIFLRFFSNNSETTANKTFIDRQPSALINPEPDNIDAEHKDELVAFGFKVNASNFTELFPEPTQVCSNPKEAGCWGGDGGTGCYPWHSLNDESCNTFQYDGKYSRTCRIDACKSGYLKYTFDCTRDDEGNLNEPSNVKTERSDYFNSGYKCTDKIRDLCMMTQKKAFRDPALIPPESPTCEYEGTGIVEDYIYDYCLVARAGPNECDGDILLDAEVKVNSQTIYDQDDLNSPKSYNADAVPEAGLDLYYAFEEPFSEKITPLPAAWVSVSSSLSEIEPDVSLRKDFPGIGSGTNFLIRTQFGEPHPISSSNELAPLYIHCANEDLETEGTWDDGKGCSFENAHLPAPEITTIEKLENDLEILIEEKEDEEKPTCLLNENIHDCENLVLGTSETGQQLIFSDTFKLILNLAGNKFDVEPAAILVYMHKIGADKKYSYYWSTEGEEDLKKASLPWYGGFDFCDDLEPVKQPPYDFKLTWFSEMLKAAGLPAGTTNSSRDELEDTLERQDTASRCNFIDSTFTLAGSLARTLYRIEGYGDDIRRKDIKCDQQRWDGYMKEAMKIQYYQLQITPEKEELKGELKDIDIFSTNSQEYQDIWNACK